MTSKRSDESVVPPETEHAVRADYDWTAIPPSTAVIETVAIALDRKPTGTEPLYEAVDPDALNTLIRSTDPDLAEDELTVMFRFAGQSVTVHVGGTVVVQPAEAHANSD